MDERAVLDQVREALVAAMDARRELVAYSRMEAIEMDRRARETEREALTKVRGLLPGIPGVPQLQQVKTRLERMDDRLEELGGRTDIQDRSRALEQDDITWRTFEDIAWLLGIG